MDPDDLKTNTPAESVPPQATFSPPTQPPQPPSPSIVPGGPPVSAVPPHVIASQAFNPSVPPNAAQPIIPNAVVGGGSTGPVVGGDGGLFAPDPPAQFPAGTVIKGPKQRPTKMLLLILLAVVVLGGGSALAYVGVIVPNKPANVLKTALVNTAQSTQVNFNGNVDVAASADGGIASKVDIKGAADSVAKSADIQANVTVSGVSLPLEARYVDKNAYLKVGDFGSLAGLANTFSPDLGAVVTQANSIVANKWIVVDSTLLSEAGGDCYLNASWNLTSADVKLLENQYTKSQFVTIKSTGSDTVNGQSTEKFVLTLNDDKAASFANGLKGLSLVKTITKCAKSSSTDIVSSDHKTTPLTLWVDKGTKKIVQLSTKSQTAGTLTMQFNYNKVSIVKPSGAVPAVQILTQVENSFASSGTDPNLLFGGTSGTVDVNTGPVTLTQ